MKKKILSIILAAAMTASISAAAVSAEDAELAKGLKFTKESGYTANTYTGYVGGVELDTTVGDLLGALENSNGVKVMRDSQLNDSDKIQHGDKLVLTDEAGETKEELSIVFMGNANADNSVNLLDVASMLKKIALWDEAIDEVASDVNGDGSVNLSDVALMLQMIAKWDVAFVNVPVIPGKISTRVSRAQATCAFDAQPIANANLKAGEELGVKFTVPEGEYAMSIKAVYPSWGDDRGKLTLSIFKWTGDYESTVAAMPIKSAYLDGFKDCGEYVFDLTDSAGKGLAEGEYLWLCHEGYDERVEGAAGVGIGLWTYLPPAADTGMETYYQGVLQEPGAEGVFSPEAYITFATEA